MDGDGRNDPSICLWRQIFLEESRSITNNCFDTGRNRDLLAINNEDIRRRTTAHQPLASHSAETSASNDPMGAAGHEVPPVDLLA